MEPRHILPSNYSPQVSSDAYRPKQPLGESTGNAQPYTLATSGPLHDHNVSLYDHAAPKFSLPTLPYQHNHSHLGGQLGLRRDHFRRQRQQRVYRNPIAESPQYQQYRNRQTKETDGEQKWPVELEEAFLDALTNIPKMGRRKFSLGGKPHGRNELISLYIWIAYCESLPPGVAPDPTMQRTRKQVSSHIQVLKGFMRNHPQFDRLFPSKDNPKNGFEDSFKTDQCLIALSKNRLPHRRRREYEQMPPRGFPQLHAPVKPTHFDMVMRSPAPGKVYPAGVQVPDEDLITSHEFYNGAPSPMARDSLESITGWRSKFPLLAMALNDAQSQGNLDFDIVNISVSLSLSTGPRPEESQLWGSSKVWLPAQDDRDFRACWRCESSVYKPTDLYSDHRSDKRYEAVPGIVSVERFEAGGCTMRAPFPASPWAYALAKLTEMDNAFQEARDANLPPPPMQSARQYIEQISMYQELFSQSSPQVPWKRRVVLLWTFNKAPTGASGHASWRYLDVAPPRQQIFEPHPPLPHMVSAAMNNNYNAWVDPLSMQDSHDPNSSHPNMHNSSDFDPLMHGLATPPHTAGLQNPFNGYGYTPSHDLPADSGLSFMTNSSGETESTLVDPRDNQISSLSSSISSHPSTYQSQDSDHLSHNQADLSFESLPNNSNIWSGGVPGIESFDGDSNFLSSFGNTVTGHLGANGQWEISEKGGPDLSWEVGGKGQWDASHGMGALGGPYEAGITQNLK